MATQITLDTEQVLAIASTLESDNQKLQQLLNDSKTTINNLSATYTGQAAEATRDSYNQFSGKFFQQYYDVLNQYVTFLRKNVSQDYSNTEVTNVKLADAFS